MAKDKKIYKPKINPNLLINKLEKPTGETLDIDRAGLYAQVNAISAITESNKEVLELFPDLEVAKQTLVSNIVGGMNMFNNPLVYTAEDSDMGASGKGVLVSLIEKHMDKIYGLKDKLTPMVNDALFGSGSYCEVLIPENALSDMLNSKLLAGTDIEEQLDLISVNSLDIEEITVKDADNIKVDLGLTIGKDLSVLNRSSLDSSVKDSIEGNMGNLDIEELSSLKDIKKLFLKDRVEREGRESIHIGTIDDIKREALGIPLILKVPSESIIPITTTYDSSQHIKYILLLDGEGNPLKVDNNNNYSSGLDGVSSSDIIKQAVSNQIDNTDNTRRVNISNEAVYNSLSSTIMNRINNGTIHKTTPAMLNMVYYTAFSRYLRNEKCRMVILDTESVNYLAFDYRNNGTGKSLLEKLGPLVSMRAVLLMTRMNAHIDNTITKFKVVADLDEKDPHYKKTAATIIKAAYNSRSGNMLFGIRDFKSLNELINRAGIYFQINHPKLPKMSIDFENVNTDKREPDTDFYDSLKRDSLKVFGLTPENIEDASQDEYATGLKIKNALFGRRIATERNKLSLFTTSYVRKAISCDMMIQNVIRNYITNNLRSILKESSVSTDTLKALKKHDDKIIVEYLFANFLESFKCRLPQEEPIENNVLNEAYTSYKDRLEEYVETMFSPEALPEEFLGAVSGKLDAIKGAVTSTLLRKWMADNNYMSEVVSVFDVDDDGVAHNSPAEEFVGYLKRVLESSNVLFGKDLAKILKQSTKMEERFNKFVENGGEEEPEPEPDEGAGEEPEPEEGAGEEPEPDEGGEEEPV